MSPRHRIPLTEWAGAGRSFDYRGHRVFFREDGRPDADVLVLIHGFPTASWDWEALWPQLTRRFRVLAPDLIGFGFSAKPPDYDYSLIDQASLIEALLSRQGVASYHVLAHDYGDSVAQELLARQADAGIRPRLRSVAFLNGGLFPETHRPVLIQRMLMSPLGAMIGRFASRARLARSLHGIFGPATPPDDELVDDFWSLIIANDGRAVMHKLIRYVRERRAQRARWVGALQQARIPLKLIDGAADPVSGAHVAERYRQLVPRADVTLLADIGHYPQVEAPAAVLRAYLEFRARFA